MTDKHKKHSVRIGDTVSAPSYRIEADGRGKNLCVAVIGIIGVKEFSQNRINVITKRESLVLCGRELKISVFENKTVEISGEITEISFSARKRGDRGL